MRCLPLLFVALLAGCGNPLAGPRSIDHKQTLTFHKSGRGGYTSLPIDSQPIDRTITVEFDSTEPLSVFVVTEPQYIPALSAIEKGELPKESIGSTRDAKKGTATARLPGKQHGTVLFTGMQKSATIQVHLHD